MPNIHFLLNKEVIVKRRDNWETAPAPRDILNAPSYGSTDSWTTIYPALRCRIETTNAPIQFKPTGERVPPSCLMYIDEDVDIKAEDRIYDGDNYYIVEGKQTHWDTVGGVHHYEYSLLVP
jgi:hypothetical protein